MMSYGACGNQLARNELGADRSEATSSVTDKKCYYTDNSFIGGLIVAIFLTMLIVISQKHEMLHVLSTHDDHIDLLLLRHALSSWEVPIGTDDFYRPLQQRGFEEASRMGTYLKKKKVMLPDLIVISPSLRTRQTLERVMQAWVNDNWNFSTSSIPLIWNEDLYNCHYVTGDDVQTSSQGYMDIVHALDGTYRRVMLVGHNPAMGQLARRLLDTMDDSILHHSFPTGTYLEMSWSAQYIAEKCSELDLSPPWECIGDGSAKLVMFESPSDIKNI